MSSSKPNISPIWLVVIAVLLWSTGGLFIKLTTLDAYQVTFFRSLLAGITVIIATRKNGLRINFFGFVCSLIYAILLFLFVWATKHTTAANAIFLQYTAPIYILILSPFVIGEKFHFRDLATVIVCIAGMSLFFVGKLEISDYQGNIAALGSGIFLGLYIMLLRHPKATRLPANAASSQGSPPYEAGAPAAASASGVDVGGVAAASADGVVLSERIRQPSINPVITVIYGNFMLALVTLPSGIAAIPSLTFTDIFAVSFLGIVQIGISYILFIKGVSGGTRPLDASIIGFIEPLLNPVWVFLFVGEQPSNWAVLGGIIIIATVVIHTLVQYRLRNT
ncbi:MAG TPA: DMT family transporter [Pyrinomonadaceae bacterium]|nr:DMT family transporter [Pyrinomonadaceae bacterium]